MTELKYDPRNYRIHTDKNKRLIRKSLEECGAGRSILFDNDDCLIAGNGVYEQAQALGLKVRIIESDGTELIAIKRTDLSTEDARRKALAWPTTILLIRPFLTLTRSWKISVPMSWTLGSLR